jgi:hypothetical protein
MPVEGDSYRLSRRRQPFVAGVFVWPDERSITVWPVRVSVGLSKGAAHEISIATGRMDAGRDEIDEGEQNANSGPAGCVELTPGVPADSAACVSGPADGSIEQLAEDS